MASLIAALTLGLSWGQAQAELRVALVIGNAAYKDAPLKNPVNDARAMAARLKELGFEVVARENATRAAMGAAVNEFTRKLSPGAVALIFYAGHGIQSRGRNYLIPVDAALGTEADLGFQAVDIGLLTAELDQARTRVSFVILDACRNNPFERRLRGAPTGLAAVDAAAGTLIAYATAPGSVAADGEGENGVYTAALLTALAVPNLKAEEVFKRVRIQVTEQTQKQQTPWESSSLTGDFVFNARAGAPPPVAAPSTAAAAPPSPATDREALFWQSVKDTNDPAQLQAYLDQYPRGEFAPLARARLAALQRPAPPPAAAPAPAAGPAATASRSAFDGAWEGEDGVWRITARIAGDRFLGTIRCRYNGRWSVGVPRIGGTIGPDGTVAGATTDQPRFWSPRRIEGKMPRLRIVGDGKIGDCPDGDVALRKIN